MQGPAAMSKMGGLDVYMCGLPARLCRVAQPYGTALTLWQQWQHNKETNRAKGAKGPLRL